MMVTSDPIIQRRKDWEAHMVAYLNSQLNEPFIWGERDCVSLALETLKAMCGDFQHPPLNYSNEREAVICQVRTQMGLYDFMKLNFDTAPVKPGAVQRGDILFVRSSGRFEHCWVVTGESYVSVLPTDGCKIKRLVDLEGVKRALRIGICQ